ncbi:MAG: phosphatidylinositol mannoside acyltransferase [Acidimicrobiales bacterium]|nr:phosphatidylinositol mannoside acyltransferase [Acidimicrobiales bacterium]
MQLPIDPVTGVYKLGSVVARSLPWPWVIPAADAAGTVAAQLLRDRRGLIAKNLRRADPELCGRELDAAIDAAFDSYARYWVESFRLPMLSADELDATFSYEGYDHIVTAREQGHGAIIALPHLGGWEWAAFWLATIEDVPISAVVEAIEPPELFDWFVELRSSLGMNIIGLGPRAGSASLRALRDGHVLCLLCDRDIGGQGVEVEFFGETTTLPPGPATLAFRTGSPLLPTAIYFDGSGHRARVDPPLPVERRGSLREDVARVTQDLAYALEDLIRAAPEQWHLLQPNWPSDLEVVTPA